ncbi:MAG: hypothetical protein JO049_28800, partial [Hyphomicrobiales bacterium]|nr:hypothetical protein [Hyphomicrobiales bacterium]
RMVGNVWTDSENVFQNIGEWKRVWSHNPALREFCMEEGEREALAALPDGLTVWRGTARQRSIRGLSWTLDRDKAIWFAKRFPMRRRAPRLVEGFVHKRHVLAYFWERKEKEIVSMRVDVRGVTVLSP